MKKNGNNLRTSDYYIGLDVGTNSVGWAVTDFDYNILRFKGNSMWGVRLFEDAKTAADRRTARTARRRLARRHQRLELLELFFNDEIAKIDPNFFTRLKESSLVADDRNPAAGKYSLFNDPDYTDKDYLKTYKTIYHLRKDLVYSDEPHDIRLVYLALHHIIKYRGHFLFEGNASGDSPKIEDALNDLCSYISNTYEVSVEIKDAEHVISVLEDASKNTTAKKKELKGCLKGDAGEDSGISLPHITDMLAGATTSLAALFADEELKNAEIKSVSLKTDIDEIYDTLAEILGERVDLILELKKVYDIARLTQILGKASYFCEAKVAQYDKNHADLLALKRYVRSLNDKEKYDHIFSEKKDKLNNYAAYSGYKLSSGDYTCKQEDFCKFLSSELKGMAEDTEMAEIWKAITDKTFLPKLKGTDNSIVPNQLHRAELEAILKNASAYLPFLCKCDETGKTVAEKIVSIFDFKIPYYVGPLNNKSSHGWVIRTADKIYPWNFEEVVDLEKSAGAFMTNLIGKCKYTGDKVLPADSLLYSKYKVLNEINPIKVNGQPLSAAVKQQLFNDLFVNSKAKVTKKRIKDYLACNGFTGEIEITGIDDAVKSKLKSLHDFKQILDRTGNEKMVEDIIQSILVFGDDKKMLKRWLKREYPVLTEKDVAYICRLKYSDWGRFSRALLETVYVTDADGVIHTIMDELWNTNDNFMQIINGRYGFEASAAEYRNTKYNASESLESIFEDLYINPAVRRSTRQALKIVDEIVDIRKSAPKKLFIEVERENLEDAGRTVSRKEKLLGLYKASKEISRDIYLELENIPEDRLRSDKIYLYFAQHGRCMYTGEEIDFEKLMQGNAYYDIDHIFPRSRIKDDSLDNRVLVKAEVNRDKTNEYPINQSIRTTMMPMWKQLKAEGFVSDKKYERLTRNAPLTVAELSDFVARQLVETSQSAKALATIMGKLYPETSIVYSKAGNVSKFRQDYGFVKCREVNDLHHAKDAYLNIVVGNVYDTKFTKQFFRNIENEKYSLNKVFDYDTPGAWVAKGVTLATVKKYMAKNNILFTRMPYEVKGALYDLQILAKGKGQLPIKAGKSIDNYGGYNKMSGAYFFAVEHDGKKGRIKTIEPIYIYAKQLYEQDPIKYCETILSLRNPVIISRKILIDSMIERNGNLLSITGRSENRLLFKHCHQLCVDDSSIRYIKNAIKYLERCKKSGKRLDITDFDGINTNSNIYLFKELKKKINHPPYHSILTSLSTFIDNCDEPFENLNVYEQTVFLTELIKAFKCNRETVDCSLLNGPKSGGIIIISKNIGETDTIKQIHQSVTGLYTYKTELV